MRPQPVAWDNGVEGDAVKLADLCIEPSDSDVPYLDRKDTGSHSQEAFQNSWIMNGYVILPKFYPSNILDAYSAVREKADGWEYMTTPYMVVPELKDLCCYGPLQEMLTRLIGEPMGLHLNLCGWVSTERDWHQDIYLNPPEVKGHYLAVWVALDDIHPDSGPFEYVPGSHRWGYLSREKTLQALLDKGYCTQGEIENGSWPRHSEKLLTPILEQELAERGAKVEKFIANKGDVLIWHGQLMHRGSTPNVRGMIRKAVISHYSGINHRPDMPRPVNYNYNSWFFPIHNVWKHPPMMTSGGQQ